MKHSPTNKIILGLVLAQSLIIYGLAQAKAPNIIFIAVDDLRPVTQAMGGGSDPLFKNLYPNVGVRQAMDGLISPNINALAASSVVFTQAYTPSPRCNPSRTAILTGVAPETSRYFDENSTNFRDYPMTHLSNAKTLPEFLKNYAGYHTVGFGKVFHYAITPRDIYGNINGGDWTDSQRSWSQWIDLEVGTQEAPYYLGLPGSAGINNYGIESNPKENQYDYINATLAKTLLQTGKAITTDFYGKKTYISLPTANQDQPFFLAVGIKRPHSPWIVPQANINRIPIAWMNNSKIKMEDEYLDGLDLPTLAKGEIGIKNNPYGKASKLFNFNPKARAPARNRANNKLHESIQYYLAAINFADECIGQILSGLANSPYANNTVIVLWSDHGMTLGEKLHMGKTTLWEPSLHSVFMIKDTRAPWARVVTEPVSLMDIYPTIAQIVGLGAPRTEGVSLSNVLTGGTPTRNRNIISSIAHDKNRMISSNGWAYMNYQGRETELYNRQGDPDEKQNLLFNPNAATLRTANSLANSLAQTLANQSGNRSLPNAYFTYPDALAPGNIPFLPPVPTQTPTNQDVTFPVQVIPPPPESENTISGPTQEEIDAERRKEKRERIRERRQERRQERRERKEQKRSRT